MYKRQGLTGVTGNVVKNTESPGRRSLLFIVLIILGGALVFLLLGKKAKKERKVDFSKDRDYTLGRKKLEELKARGIRKEKPVEYGKASQEDVDYWKKRVQETFTEQENNKSRDEFLRSQQKSINEDKPKGLFRMFG